MIAVVRPFLTFPLDAARFMSPRSPDFHILANRPCVTNIFTNGPVPVIHHRKQERVELPDIRFAIGQLLLLRV